MPEEIVAAAAAKEGTQESVASTEKTPIAKVESAASSVTEDTILGSDGEASSEVKTGEEKKATPADDVAALAKKAEAEKAEKLKNETPEEKTAREAQEKVERESGNFVPDTYEFKIPEGMELDKGLVDTVTPIFKEAKITQAVAQKLVDAYAPYVKTQVETQQKAAIDGWKAQVKSWGEETKKEFSTGDFNKNVAPAARFISKFGGEDAKAIRQLFKETGVGNHKLIVKMLVNAGKSLVEDSFVEGKENKGGEGGVNLKALYPSMAA